MDVTFVQYPQHNVDGSDRRHYQNKLRIHGLLEHLRRSGKTAAYRRGTPSCVMVRLMASVACDNDVPVGRLKAIVDAAESP